MTVNFLLDELFDDITNNHNGVLSFDKFESFVADAMEVSDNFHNFDPDTGVVNRAHNATLLYSGNTGGTGGVYNGNIAKDIADRAGGDVRVIDNTKMGRLLGDVANATDTIYRGDKGVAEWLRNSQVPTATRT